MPCGAWGHQCKSHASMHGNEDKEYRYEGNREQGEGVGSRVGVGVG